MRKCIDQYCQDPGTPCPTDGFITCVSEATKVSLLQWDSLLQSFDNSFKLYSGMLKASKDRTRVSMLQSKLAVFHVKCEEMCKTFGEYPDNCQCPGFAGNPPSGGDMRKCIDQYCQDPGTPCPTDGFITCVSEATKVSALQWPALFQRLNSGLDMYKKMFISARNTTRHV